MKNARTQGEQAALAQGVVAVVRREAKLLVIRRSAHVVAPRAFCFPGGHIEPGESEGEALVREVREELGVTVEPLRSLWRSVTERGVAISWWQATLSPHQVLKPNPAEVESVHWFAPEELCRLEGLLSSNVQFLDAMRRGEFLLA